MKHIWKTAVAAVALMIPAMASSAASAADAAKAPKARNVVIFVADGLRYDSVNDETAPTMARIRREGVDFTNSHSVYPTLTTVNAGVIATGHMPGDHGNYANTFYLGFPVKCLHGAEAGFIEDNSVLREVKAHYPHDYLAQTTLMEAARNAGLNTVLVGKNGPLGMQYLPALESKNNSIDGPVGIFIDEGTNNWSDSPKLNTPIAGEVMSATGLRAPPYTTAPNLTQQAYEVSAVTQVLIPHLKQSGKPFALLYWSRDPDTTQHAASDSAGKLFPGINSPNSKAAIYNADRDLTAILGALKLWKLDDNTDVLVVADHGFSTIAKGWPDADGNYKTTLSNGFLAMDVAGWLGDRIFNPEEGNTEVDLSQGERPSSVSIVGQKPEAPHVLVVSNGNTEYLYVPPGPNQRALARKLTAKLTRAPYTAGLFVNDAVIDGKPDDFAGALPMSAIGMIGSSRIPNPTIVVAFRSFLTKGCTLSKKLLCAAEIADTTLDVGQGNHGSFSRADTRNYMAAIGPDFKAATKIDSPVGNIDIAPTAAYLLGIRLSGPGKLSGRVMTEALKGGKPVEAVKRRISSPKTADGIQTVIDVQDVGEIRYIDAGGVPGRVVGLNP